jgi:Protein of unknown function (DUF3892)
VVLFIFAHHAVIYMILVVADCWASELRVDWVRGPDFKASQGSKMPQLVHVDCINKTDRSSPHERIRYIGGVNPDGTRWKLTEDQAITGIKTLKWMFYVDRPPAKRVYLVIAHSTNGREYLKTEIDGEIPNNLLSLPECP